MGLAGHGDSDDNRKKQCKWWCAACGVRRPVQVDGPERSLGQSTDDVFDDSLFGALELRALKTWLVRFAKEVSW